MSIACVYRVDGLFKSSVFIPYFYSGFFVKFFGRVKSYFFHGLSFVFTQACRFVSFSSYLFKSFVFTHLPQYLLLKKLFNKKLRLFI